MNLIDKIIWALLTDDNSTIKNSNKLLSKYEKMTKEQKELVNDLFITICGYSLNTLISIDEI